MPDPVELTSWKDIAQHLGVSVKTAQSYERDRAMPVRRLPGGRSVVRASPAELDEWRRRLALPADRPPDITDRPSIRPWMLVCIAVGCVAGAWLAMSAWGNLVPSGYRIEPLAFVVLDQTGAELWRKTFATRLELDDDTLPRSRQVQIHDIDGDGSREVVFFQQPLEPLNLDRALWCYNADGSVRWKFTPGREVRTSTHTFPPPFRVLQISIGPIVRGGPVKIILSSIQVPWWAAQIAVLDATGRLEREYWHSGAIFTLELGDPDNDGYSTIYAGGINNARRQATLLALDPRTMRGASRETNPEFQLLDHEPGVEISRVFFPRTCTTHAQPYNSLRQLSINGGVVIAEVWEHPYGPDPPTIFYTLTPALAKIQAGVSDRFRVVHDQLHASRAIDHALTSEEVAKLAPTR